MVNLLIYFFLADRRIMLRREENSRKAKHFFTLMIGICIVDENTMCGTSIREWKQVGAPLFRAVYYWMVGLQASSASAGH